MNILLLGPTPEKLLTCIDSRRNVIFTYDKEIDVQFVLEKQIDILVSYNYRSIIRSDVLSLPRLLAVNLHTALLPFNRGAHPVLWSILEGTPLGITIHQIDEGLDTGPIIFQKPLKSPDVKKSLRQIYEYVNQELVDLFCENWPILVARDFNVRSQLRGGTLHRSAQAKDFLATLEDSWNTTIEDARRQYVDYLKAK
jgi:dTDP-4-amino-4,6-dideoxyglucose formyltransferase